MKVINRPNSDLVNDFDFVYETYIDVTIVSFIVSSNNVVEIKGGNVLSHIIQPSCKIKPFRTIHLTNEKEQGLYIHDVKGFNQKQEAGSNQDHIEDDVDSLDRIDDYIWVIVKRMEEGIFPKDIWKSLINPTFWFRATVELSLIITTIKDGIILVNYFDNTDNATVNKVEQVNEKVYLIDAN